MVDKDKKIELPKINKIPVITLVIILVALLIITFINPRFVHQNSFNDTYYKTDSESLDLSNNYKITEYIQRMNNWVPQEAYRSYQNKKINDTQLQNILEANSRAKEDLNGDIFRSLEFTSKVVAYQNLYPYINCASDVEEIGKRYKPLFYYLSYYDKKRISDIQSNADRANNFLRQVEYYHEDNQSIINNAKNAQDINNQLRLYEFDCERFSEYIKNDYSRQKIWFYFKLLAILGLAIIFYILGEKVGRHDKDKFKENSNRLSEKIKLSFSPKAISLNTIKSIVSINSVTSTFVAFIVVAINISALNNWIVVGSIILSVISLLSSLLLGVIAINNQEEFYKRWCYRMFVIGILLFVGFFLMFIFSGSISSIFSGAKESLQTFLNNQTIK
ncbi:MAG: hypothetical protein AABX35_00340 [Nanoarchaeota archaeon]